MQENHARRRPGSREDDGIDHGGFDFALEVLLAGAEIGDLVEHDIQKSARLAGAHHGDIDGGKALAAIWPGRRPSAVPPTTSS